MMGLVRVGVAAWCVGVGLAEPVGVFDVEGRSGQSAVVTAPWWSGAATPGVSASPMLRSITGVMAGLSSRELGLLRRSVARRTRVPEDVRTVERLASVHVISGAGVRRVELERVEHGWILARSEDGSALARLEGDDVEGLVASWGRARPDPSGDAGGEIVGEPFDLVGPLTPSPIRLDERTVGERLSGGGASPFAEPMTRDLSSSRMSARLPLGHRRDRPSGLLVWISPTDEGVPPPEVAPAADAMGLITIAVADAGNDRPAIDRLQLALDAVATASRRWWVDGERVYVAGLSGGGRVASMLWTGFPDVFTGGVGVVGMNSHHMVGIGDGRFWPKTHEGPRGEMARRLALHRFAVISGPRDFNFKEIQGRAARMTRDGLSVRVFDSADQSHAMATPARFEAALAWVDAVVTGRRAETAVEGERLLSRALSEQADGRGERAAGVLERVTLVAPWTDPAWRAAELLGQGE